MNPPLVLDLLPGRLAIRELGPSEAVPEGCVSVTVVGRDRSVVQPEEAVPLSSARSARGYRCLRLRGEFPLEATGVLASLTGPLAGAGIPVLTFSTFATDYLLIREADLPAAASALAPHGTRIVPEPSPDTA